MTSPAISVVMPVYNGERFLAESLESILRQDFTDFELIILDDGSTDGSAEILNRYQKSDVRVRLHCEGHRGLVPTLNRGLALATGKFIARMDADDVAKPDRFSLQMAFFQRNPKVAILGAAVEWINAEGESLFISRHPTGNKDIKKDLFLRRRCVFWHPTILMRREAFEQTGGYRGQLMGAEDYDLWLRVAERFDVANLEEVLVRYRIHPGQVSIQQRLQQTRSTLAAQLAAKRRGEGRPDPIDEVKEVTSKCLADWGISVAEQQSEIFADYRKWIRMMCEAGEFPSALRAAHEAVATSNDAVERWQLADVHMMIAKILWRRARYVGSMSSLAHAVMLRPLIVGRPLKRLWSNNAG